MIRMLIILLLNHSLTIFGLDPPGCYVRGDIAACDFRLWSPPLIDGDFGLPFHSLRLNSINGTIPDGAFSGLNGSRTENMTHIHMYCNTGITRLSREIFTPNLHWVTDLAIFDCYLEEGLSSRLLENLISLKSLIISRSRIKGLVAPDTLAGLTNLLSIFVDGPITTGRLPSGFFEGLTTLAMITVRFAELDFIPPDWFNGLVNLERITLKNNNLQTLPPGLFVGLRSLADLRLAGNPWNCSCGLRWLLDWSHIIDRVVCHSPSSVQNVAFESAADLLKCASTTPAILSSSMLFELETTATQVNSFTSFAGSLRSRVTTVSSKERIASTFTLTEPISKHQSTTVIKRIVTSTHRPRTLTAASTLITSTTLSVRISSSEGSTKDKLGASKTASGPLSVFSAHSTFAQEVTSSIPNKSNCLHSRNISADIVRNIRFIIVISCVSVFTLLIIFAALLYRCVYRNKCVRR